MVTPNPRRHWSSRWLSPLLTWVCLLGLLPLRSGATEAALPAVSSGQYAVRLSGTIPMTGNAPVVSSGFFYIITPTSINAYKRTAPSTLVWTFVLEVGFCCPNSTSNETIGSSSSGSDNSGPLVAFCGAAHVFPIDPIRILITCGPTLAVFNGSTGAILSVKKLPNENVVQQVVVVGTDLVAIRTYPAAQYYVANTTSWEMLWSRVGVPTQPPVISGTNGIVIAIDFLWSYGGVVTGYNAVSGTPRWNESFTMWAMEQVSSLPNYCPNVFMWVGPEFASIRVLWIPTGVVWQYVPSFNVMNRLCTNDGEGIVIIASDHVVVGLDPKQQSVLWTVTLSVVIASFQLSPDSAYVVIWPVNRSLDTIILSTRSGATAITCGPGRCALPCVALLAPWNVSAIAKCGNAPRTLDITIYDPRTGAPLSSTVTVPITSPLLPMWVQNAGRGVVLIGDDNASYMWPLVVSHASRAATNGTASLPPSPSSSGVAPFFDMSSGRFRLVLGAVTGLSFVAMSAAALVRLRRHLRDSSATPEEINSALDPTLPLREAAEV